MCCRTPHSCNSHTKFGWISSTALGGDSITDRRTDGGDINIKMSVSRGQPGHLIRDFSLYSVSN